MRPRTDAYWRSRVLQDVQPASSDPSIVVKLLSQNAIASALSVLVTIVKQETLLIERSKLDPRPFEVSADKPTTSFCNDAIESSHKEYVLRHRAQLAHASERKSARRAELHAESAYVFGRNALQRSGYGATKFGFNAKPKVGARRRRGAESFNWVRHNARATRHKLERLEHLLALLEAEQVKEAKREVAFYDLRMAKRQQKYVRRKVARSRAKAADMIMQTLVDYGFISIVDYANYLKAIPKQHQALKLSHTVVQTREADRPSRRRPALTNDKRQRPVIPTKAAEQGCELSVLCRRYQESSSTRAQPVSPTVASPAQGRFVEEDPSWNVMGGWGERISHEAERIIDKQKVKLANFQRDKCPVYGVNPSVVQYSHLLNRPIPKHIPQSRRLPAASTALKGR